MLLLNVAAAVPLFSVKPTGKLKLPILIATMPEPPAGDGATLVSAAPRPVFAAGVALAQTVPAEPQPPAPYSTAVPVIEEVTPTPPVLPLALPPAPPPPPAPYEPVPKAPRYKLPPLLEPVNEL